MLILFDIDGTLLLTERAGMHSMLDAGRRLAGPGFSFDGVEFAGRLDPLIWADAAAANGLEATESRHAEFRSLYATMLAERLEAKPTAAVLPGVEPLLAALRAIDGVDLGLLTGNYPETGRLKLAAAGLDADDFAVAAWGCDGSARRDLPPVAMDRYRARHDRTIEPHCVVIIGDTPHDIDCAQANGCRSLGVATGPSHSLADIEAHEPDLALADLSDTGSVVAWLCGIGSA